MRFAPARPDPLALLTTEHKLLLQAILGEEEEAQQACRRWLDRIVFDEMDLASFQLLPQLHHRYSTSKCLRPIQGRLHGIHKSRWYRNQLLSAAATKLLIELRLAGIDSLLLKGIGVAAYYDGDIGTRPMEDVDLLIKPRDISHCIDLLYNAGWTSQPCAAKFALKQWPTLGEKGCSFKKGIAALDLHWNATHIDFSRHSQECIWQYNQTLQYAGRSLRVPAATEQLYIACVHGMRWESPRKLLWITDGVHLLRNAEEQIDWERLLFLIKRSSLLSLFQTALPILQEYGAEIPESVRRQLYHRTGIVERFEHGALLLPPLQRSALDRLSCRIMITRRRARGGKFVDRFRALRFLLDPPSIRRQLSPLIFQSLGKYWWLRQQLGDLVPKLFYTPVSGPDTEDIVRTYAGETIRFGTGHRGVEMAIDGWSTAENDWLWSVGHEATLLFSIGNNPDGALALLLRVDAYLPDNNSRTIVDVLVQGKPLVRWTFHGYGDGVTNKLLTIAPDRIVADGIVVLTFQVHNPGNPSREAKTDDDRNLGLRIYSMVSGFIPEILTPATTIGFAENEKGLTCLLGGWAISERGGTWSVGKRCEMIFTVDTSDLQDFAVAFQLQPFLPPDLRTQLLRIRLANKQIAVWKLDSAKMQEFTLDLSSCSNLGQQSIRITFDIAAPVSPFECGLSSDRRKLGIYLHSLYLQPFSQIAGTD